MTIALPVALQAMLQSSFSMIDQLMVGQLGKTAIASVEIGGKPQFIFTFVSGAIATVTGIMVSQYMGRQEQKKINTSMSSNLLVMLALAALTVMACFFLPSTVAGIFTTDGGGLHANFGLYLPTVRDGLHLGRSYALLQLRPIPALHKCGGSRGQYGLELPLDFW